MSFPSRPPLGMPPMGPGMMHQTGYAFAPMGMMPMGMQMMAPPPMIRPVVTTASTQNIVKTSKKLVPQEIPKDEQNEEKPPVTTVFIGNISDRAPDMMVKQMLQRCGNVLSWKRVQGASGKLQAFGFCEYEDPEATLRCIRLLNEWNIAEKKLVVKVDAKTKTLLDEYRAKKKEKEKKSENGEEKKTNGDTEEEKEETKSDENQDEDELDEDGKREDRVAKAGLEAIMREYTFELSKPSYSEQDKETKEKTKKKEDKGPIADTGLDDMELEEGKLQIINREIQSFRDLHKDEDEDKVDNTDRERRNEEKNRKRELERIREKERERMRERERVLREKTRSRTRSPSPHKSRRRSRSRDRDRGDRDRDRSRDRSRERRRERELEEEEEAYERRKLEKKLREKEAAYQERLKNWEARERKKSREYDKEKEREDERKAEEQREGRRLKEFLEDYDDLRDDPKYFKGTALARRLKEREKEKEADSRDRQREKEEFEEIRRKLMDEGHPDPDTELAKLEKQRQEHLQPRLHLQPESEPSSPEEKKEEEPAPAPAPAPAHNSDSDSKSRMQPTLKPVTQAKDPTSNDASSSDEDTRGSFPSVNFSDDSQQPTTTYMAKDEPAKLGFSGLKLGSTSPSEGSGTKRKKLTVGDVFNQDDEDSLDSKKRKLIPLDYDEEKSDKKPSTAEEKRQRIKHLIESIPTAKDELFNYPLDWNIVDQSLMDKRIKPWVNKKIIEYIGEEEPTLTDFICQKVVARSTPASIQNDVAMVLDEEAEVFVVKMWRLIVYETEAKKLGLVK